MKPVRAATFYQMLTARGECDSAPPTDRAGLGGDEYRGPCGICKRVTVWKVINVAGRLTVVCSECAK